MRRCDNLPYDCLESGGKCMDKNKLKLIFPPATKRNMATKIQLRENVTCAKLFEAHRIYFL
jgi:hypothetical protein